jgi:hypothetical protein
MPRAPTGKLRLSGALRSVVQYEELLWLER